MKNQTLPPLKLSTRRIAAISIGMLFLAPVVGRAKDLSNERPEVLSGGPLAYLQIATQSAPMAVTTANPLATQAALKMLQTGGSAVDAAISAQLVLGLVEPQSSGLGGGSFLMHWSAQKQELSSFDGLSAAPSQVTPALTLDVDGTPLPYAEVSRGGRSVGVPGTLPLLEKVHAQFGKLPWPELFQPAIQLALNGFPMPAYMHGILSAPRAASEHPDMASLYFDAQGKVKPIGTLITHPAYARTLQTIAAQGKSGVWANGAGAEFVAAAQRGFRPSLITEDDLKNYKVEQRDPLCAPFLSYRVCVMAPPSFGGVVVLQVLQMLEKKTSITATTATGQAYKRFDFDNPEFVHLFAEAGKLAQADRAHYVADPAFVKVPSQALVAKPYLDNRSALISAAALTEPTAGQPSGLTAPVQSRSLPATDSADATSHLNIVDGQGNALTMTTTNNLNFGSRLMTQGYVLNNAMTNFSDAAKAGQSAPNRMEPGKRPVTSMVPAMVFDGSGALIALGGSAGGGQIVDYVSANLIRILANHLSPAEALAQGHVSTAVRGKLQLEKGSPAALMSAQLESKGHAVEVVPMQSGMGFIKRQDGGWIGAADPRRDGIALGMSSP